MKRGRRNSQSLGSLWHRGIVDGLNVNSAFCQQETADSLALFRVADRHRHDMRVIWNARKPVRIQHRFQASGASLVQRPFVGRNLQMPDRRRGGGADGRRQRRREYEARRIGSYRVDERAGAREIAAETTERLRQRPFDNVNLAGHAKLLADSAAARAVHTDRVDLVAVGHGVVAFGQGADGLDGGDIPVHRVEAFEHDQLWSVHTCLYQEALKMRNVVVPKYP